MITNTLVKHTVVRRGQVPLQRMLHSRFGAPPALGAASVAVGATTVAGVGTVAVAGASSQTVGATTITATGHGVPVDGPSNVFTPQTTAHFTSLGITAPTHLWLCQDAASPLAATVGGIDLTATGTGLSYENTVTGWTRKFIGTTDAAANARWGTTNAALDIGANTSMAMLLYAAANSNSLTRGLGALSGDDYMIAVVSTFAASCRANGGATNGAVADFDNITTVRPLLYVRDCVANTTRVYTNSEQISHTHTDNAGSAGSVKGIGAPGLSTPDSRVGLCAVWHGTAAEGLDKTTLTRLGWSIPY